MARASKSSALTGVIGPVRTCVGCRERAAKSELMRVVAGTDQLGRRAVLPDPTTTAPGRGAYLHPTASCVETAIRRRVLTRALRVAEGLDTAELSDCVPLVPDRD